MRSIAIIGAGQAGLYLGISLLEAGYQVTLFSDRTPEAMLNSPLKAVPILLPDALKLERDLGLDFWKNNFLGCNQFVNEIVNGDNNTSLIISSPLEQPWQGIDQRLTFSIWMQKFVCRGGALIIQSMTVADLEECAKNYDLVVVSAGRGAISSLFERDEEKCIYNKPQRHLAGMIVRGFKRSPQNSHTLKLNTLPGIGEIFYCSSFYDKDKINASVIAFEIYPGSVIDGFDRVQNGQELLAIGKQIIKQFLPWDYDKVKDTELADEQSWVSGSIVPTVRKPVGHLSSGAIVMGIGDTVILNDPIGLQGANSATKMAHLVAQRIVDRGQGKFDRSWMEEVFAEFWQYSQYVNAYSNCLLSPPAHLQDLVGAMAQNSEVVMDYLNGVNHPPSLSPWFFEPKAAREYLAQLTSPGAPR